MGENWVFLAFKTKFCIINKLLECNFACGSACPCVLALELYLNKISTSRWLFTKVFCVCICTHNICFVLWFFYSTQQFQWKISFRIFLTRETHKAIWNKKAAISLRKTRWAHINVIDRTPKRFFNCSHVLSLSLSNASEATRNQILINTRISHPFNVSPTLTKQNYMPALSKNVHHYSFIAPFHNYRGHT